MNLDKLARLPCGTSVVLLGPSVVPAVVASASSNKTFVLCGSTNGGAAGLVAAIAAANNADGGAVNLAPACNYTATRRPPTAAGTWARAVASPTSASMPSSRPKGATNRPPSVVRPLTGALLTKNTPGCVPPGTIAGWVS